jgi:hypothetical protein
MSMEEIKLRVISEPLPGMGIINPAPGYGDRPLFEGQDPNGKRYVCGGCGHVLMDNIGNNFAINDVLLKCPSCLVFNLANTT